MVRWSNLFIFPLFMRKCTSHKVVTRNYEKSTSILKMRATTTISQGRWQEKHFWVGTNPHEVLSLFNKDPFHPHFLRDVIHAYLTRVKEGFKYLLDGGGKTPSYLPKSVHQEEFHLIENIGGRCLSEELIVFIT